MKKSYESPVFFAEAYSFSDSIAKCEYQVSTRGPVALVEGERLCGGNGNCHQFSFSSGAAINDSAIGAKAGDTIFNDSPATDKAGEGKCTFDWGGIYKKVVRQTGMSFAQSFFGNEASTGNHSAGYEGEMFFS